MDFLTLYNVPLEKRDYDWWDLRARESHPLTDDEKKVIYGCGGLTYLHQYMCKHGPSAVARSVSEKHYIDCIPGCICGRN